MNRKILSEKYVREKEKAISPIIATLLLILIAIAAGVVVYAYVIGFIGNSTSNSGATTSVIQVNSACISTVATHCNGGQYYITLENVGSTTLGASGVVQIYFQDITNPATGTISCPLTAALAPSGSVVIPAGCTGPTGSLLSITAGDSVSIKVVAADGGSATFSTKVIS